MKISVSREGLKTISRSGLSPLARIEAGYQAFARSGPGYDEELARPVQALVLLGRPRLLLVRGNWRHGRYGQYHVARGADFLEPHSASEVSYVPLGKTDEAWPFPDPNEETAAVKEPFPSPSEGPRNAYDSLMRANWAINEVFYGFNAYAEPDERIH